MTEFEKLVLERLDALDKKINDESTKIKDSLETIQIKQEVLSRKIDDVTFQVASLEHTTKKHFHKLDDEVETLIAVLEAKDILPKQA